MRAIKYTALVLMVFGCTGCATIMSGTTQKINVTSQPSDATAKVDNNLSAKTPAVFTLERKSDHAIEISKEGYKTATILIKKTMNGMTFGNALVGGLIGTGVDMASGATNKLVPERVDIALEPGSGASDIPKFIAQKDQEYYERNILKTKAQKEEPKKKAEPSRPLSNIQEPAGSQNATIVPKV